MLLRLLFSFVFLWVIGFMVQRSVNLYEVLLLIGNFPKSTLSLILFLSSMILFLKAVRFHVLLRHANISISFWEVVKISLAGQATSALPAGEMMRGYLIRKEVDVTFVRTTGPIILQALLEIATAVIFTAIGSIFIEELRVPALIVLLFVLLLLYLLYHESHFQRVMTYLPDIRYLRVLKKKLISTHDVIRSTMVESKRNTFTHLLLNTIGIIALSNIIGGFIIYLIATSLSVDLNIFFSIFIYSSSIVISTIGGISPGGLGFTESGMTGILLLSGVVFSKTVAIVLLFRLVTFVYSVATGLLFLILFYGKTIILRQKKDK